MTDWKTLVTDLQNDNLSIRIFKDDKIVYTSDAPMLKPLFAAYKLQPEDLKGATVVDKIIGRAAAYICITAGVKEVFTPLASDDAKSVLDKAGISLNALKFIPKIINRDGTDQCPMEKMAQAAGSPEAFMKELEKRIKL